MAHFAGNSPWRNKKTRMIDIRVGELKLEAIRSEISSRSIAAAIPAAATLLSTITPEAKSPVPAIVKLKRIAYQFAVLVALFLSQDL